MSETAALVPLHELVESCTPGEWGDDPINGNANCVVYRATDIDSEGKLNEVGGAARCVAPSKLLAKSLRPGDILLEASGGSPDQPVGRVALFAGAGQMPAVVSNFFRSMRPRSGVDSRFLVQQLVALNRGPAIWRYQQQTTGLTNLKVSDYLTHRLWVPDLPSQRRIAAILTSLDTAIEATEALIEKHQQIKAGLMHDLFTRGVVSTGELRPPPDVAPDSYRSGLLGVIPRTWREVVCRDLCSRICVGIVIQPAQYYTEAGVPALRSANVRENEIDPTNMVAISDASNAMLAKSMLRKGDIVTVRTGYPGTSAVVPPELDGANCIDILISSPGAEVDSRYLCYWLNSPFGKGQVLRKQGGLAQQHFNVGDMRELVVALPDRDEQLRIRATLERSDAVLRSERAMLEKLRLKKQGLMQDLLTGKVRVPVPADASA